MSGFGARGLSAMAMALGLVTALSAVPSVMPESPARVPPPGHEAGTQ